jgi:tetratricopeptide (TPR) repeat protein
LGEFAEALKDKNALIATKDGASNFALFASRGAIYARMNNYDKAIADFSKAIALAPTQSVRTEYKTRRNAYLSAGKLDLACADAEKVISLNPEDEDGYFFISFVHMRQLKYKKAVEDLNEAIKKDPYKRQTLYFECRADAHFQAREYKDAIADYTTAIDIDSTQPWLFGGRASSYAKTGEAPRQTKIWLH